MSGTAVVVFSDPKAWGDEALGRLFNALLLALALKEKDPPVALIFHGAGLPIVRERAVAGTTGVVGLSRRLDRGDRLVTC